MKPAKPESGAACWRLCITKTIVWSVFNSAIFFSILVEEIGSIEEQGSSSNSTFGWIAMARAIQRRCCCPPDKEKPLSLKWFFT